MATRRAATFRMSRSRNMASGRLVIVGTGIGSIGQVTQEARAFIEQADKVLFLVADPVTSIWITRLNPTAESLLPFYSSGKERLTTYLEMVDRILHYVRQNMSVCVAFYGHPGVFVYPSHEAIIRARAEGFDARMVPGVSAEDCLFADIGVDPGRAGCQSFEATDFLIRKRTFDINTPLILWQIGVVGQIGYQEGCNLDGLHVLSDELKIHYGPDHLAILYEAAQYPVCDPIIERVRLSELVGARVSAITTLYVPPKELPRVDLDMVRRLAIPETYVRKRTADPSLYSSLVPKPP